MWCSYTVYCGLRYVCASLWAEPLPRPQSSDLTLLEPLAGSAPHSHLQKQTPSGEEECFAFCIFNPHLPWHSQVKREDKRKKKHSPHHYTHTTHTQHTHTYTHTHTHTRLITAFDKTSDLLQNFFWILRQGYKCVSAPCSALRDMHRQRRDGWES